MQQAYFHGTRADLQTGDLIGEGYSSNYGANKAASWVYLAGTLEAAVWGAELAQGEGRERIYVVESTGPIVEDPNLTDQKFPGNPTLSYRSRDPLRIVGEVIAWRPHAPAQLQAMKDAIARLKAEGVEAIEQGFPSPLAGEGGRRSLTDEGSRRPIRPLPSPPPR
jgi:hypothetical protein